MSAIIKKYVLGLLQGKELADFEAQLAQDQELQATVNFYKNMPDVENFFKKSDQKLEQTLANLSENKIDAKPSLQEINRYKKKQLSPKEQIAFENKLLADPKLWKQIMEQKTRLLFSRIAVAILLILLPFIAYQVGQSQKEQEIVAAANITEAVQPILDANELANRQKISKNKVQDSIASIDYFADYFRKASFADDDKERKAQIAKLKQIVDFSQNNYVVYKTSKQKDKPIFVKNITLTQFFEHYHKDNYNEGLYADVDKIDDKNPLKRHYILSLANSDDFIELGYIKANIIKNKLQIDTIKILVEKDTLLLFAKKQVQ